MKTLQDPEYDKTCFILKGNVLHRDAFSPLIDRGRHLKMCCVGFFFYLLLLYNQSAVCFGPGSGSFYQLYMKWIYIQLLLFVLLNHHPRPRTRLLISHLDGFPAGKLTQLRNVQGKEIRDQSVLWWIFIKCTYRRKSLDLLIIKCRTSPLLFCRFTTDRTDMLRVRGVENSLGQR